jgi:hypothetical protein
MDRRNFLRSLVGGVAAAAAVRTFPFRVFSFPETLILSNLEHHGDLLVGEEFKVHGQNVFPRYDDDGGLPMGPGVRFVRGVNGVWVPVDLPFFVKSERKISELLR